MNFRFSVTYKGNRVYTSPAFSYSDCIKNLNSLIDCIYDLNKVLSILVYDTAEFVYSIEEVE